MALRPRNHRYTLIKGKDSELQETSDQDTIASSFATGTFMARKPQFIFLMVLLTLLSVSAAWSQSPRWTEQKANDWYAQQPWLVGSNYIPKSAINELEMWQQDTFDSTEIDTELGWAESIGMNTMRVFLHDLLWQQDAPGFQKRIDQFLVIASRHHIRPLFVLFDSCWDP